jgi:hypothetical protein
MEFEVIARFLHSWARWLFLALVVGGLVYFALGLIRKQAWTKQAQTILTSFSSLLGVQWVLGIVLLIPVLTARGDFGARQHWEHVFAQTVALGLAHLHFRWRRNADMPDANRWRNGLLLIGGVTLIVVVGIMSVNPLVGNAWRLYLGS